MTRGGCQSAHGAGTRKAGQVRYWQYGQAENSPDLAISDLSRFNIVSVLFDPGRIRQAERTKSELPDTAPACVHDEGSKRLVLSGLNHTTFDLTVYASQDGSPHHHARLASGCWSSFARRDSYPQGFSEGFSSSSSSSSFPDADTIPISELPAYTAKTWRPACSGSDSATSSPAVPTTAASRG